MHIYVCVATCERKISLLFYSPILSNISLNEGVEFRVVVNVANQKSIYIYISYCIASDEKNLEKKKLVKNVVISKQKERLINCTIGL